MTEIVTVSELTCPHCGHRSSEEMSIDACIVVHPCAGCGRVLRPKPGDCCVFCSFGTVPCPPVQEQRGKAGACCG